MLDKSQSAVDKVAVLEKSICRLSESEILRLYILAFAGQQVGLFNNIGNSTLMIYCIELS